MELSKTTIKLHLADKQLSIRMKLFKFITILVMFWGCCEIDKSIDVWKLGGRLIVNAQFDKGEIVEMQLDSLLSINEGKKEILAIISGLEYLKKKGNHIKLNLLVERFDDIVINSLFKYEFEWPPKLCPSIEQEVVTHPVLKRQLIELYINDQYKRGGGKELIAIYNIDLSKGIYTDDDKRDSYNQEMLKNIINEFGFPTEKMVGKDGMLGVFFIILHADNDLEWQKLMLINIKNAMENNEYRKQKLAYLIDRIKINNNEEQIFGTQIASVNVRQNKVIFQPIFDSINVNERRKEYGMLPIESYIRMNLMIHSN